VLSLCERDAAMTSTKRNCWKSKYGLLFLCFTLPLTIRGCARDVGAAAPGLPSPVAQSASTVTAIRGRHNGKLVFTSDRHNVGLNIWTMNPDGSSPTRLTHPTPRGGNLLPFVRVYDDFPVWSPDGTKIAFISNRNSDFVLYTMNADGSNVQLVTDRVPNPAAPAWSPDGTKIALSGGTPIVLPPARPVVDISVVNIDGSNLVKLTNDSQANGSPTWSPDGNQIAFISNRDPDSRFKIWVMNADGSNQRRLTDIHNVSDPRFYGDSTPSWSPDGTKILFVGSRDDNGAINCEVVSCLQVYVMNADGTNETRLTNDFNETGYRWPRWSPDATKIVFTRTLLTPDRENERGRATFIMNADGTNKIQLSNRSEVGYFDVLADWQPLLAPANEPAPSVLSFSAPSYSAFEDSGSIAITVTRTGNLNEAVSCFYATEDSTATVKHHYAPAFGTLTFAPGEASRTILIPLTDNGHVWGNRSLKIALFDNEGNATFLGGVREATVTVLERDVVPRPNNPIDDARFFVRQHYVDFLNREPDPAGLAFWMNEITSCGTDARCLDIKRQHVSAAFFLSIEFQETGYFILRYWILNPYNSENPSAGFLGFARYAQEVSRGVVVGQAGWQERLEANKRAFIQRFFDDDRIVLDFGRTDDEYVDLLFQYVREFAGVTLPQAERDALVAGLRAGIETRPTVFRRVLENEQFKRGFFNQAFVLMQYYGYLRRDPDEAGYFFWLNKLDRFGGDYIAAEMVKAFIISGEYRNRFGPP
jgi:Tol biopolymer transport system component